MPIEMRKLVYEYGLAAVLRNQTLEQTIEMLGDALKAERAVKQMQFATRGRLA